MLGGRRLVFGILPAAHWDQRTNGLLQHALFASWHSAQFPNSCISVDVCGQCSGLRLKHKIGGFTGQTHIAALGKRYTDSCDGFNGLCGSLRAHCGAGILRLLLFQSFRRIVELWPRGHYLVVAVRNLSDGNSRTSTLCLRGYQVDQLLRHCAHRSLSEFAFVMLPFWCRQWDWGAWNVALGFGDQRMRHGRQPDDAAVRTINFNIAWSR
mmetsp:Transcript_83484/g.102299  ORF Transcript_83484/g.102299 Transcript_83484/m.102299 type:complete len:210 (-) Transcript_83484:255-884(-)